MAFLPLVTISIALVRLVECSRGDMSDMTARVGEERNIPISPVQAYRKKVQERARQQAITHPVHPFPISSNEISGRGSDVPVTTPANFVEYTQPLPVTRTNDTLPIEENSISGPLVPESFPPAPVYRDDPVAPPAAYSRSSGRTFVFPAISDSVPTTTTTPTPPAFHYTPTYPPNEAYIRKPVESDNSMPNSIVAGSSEQESKIVEFKSCLMRDFEKVWNSPAKSGEVFVPRNEIEATCRGYIVKMEQLRNQCMEAMETLWIAKTKAAEKKSSENKSWWRFLTFGRR